jgi:hypothetical protein
VRSAGEVAAEFAALFDSSTRLSTRKAQESSYEGRRSHARDPSNRGASNVRKLFLITIVAFALVGPSAASSSLTFGGRIVKQNHSICTAGCVGFVYWDGDSVPLLGGWNQSLQHLQHAGMAGESVELEPDAQGVEPDAEAA